MNLVLALKNITSAAIEQLYQQPLPAPSILVNQTKPEFEGDYTIVLFSMAKPLRQSPEALGQALGTYLVETQPHLLTGFNVIKGFLNLTIADVVFTDFLHQSETNGVAPRTLSGKNVIVEFASPNTNKPLHLGHLRNIFLGWSVSQVLHAAGHDVFKTCIVNDRGVHICKSMIAWQLFGNGATPQSTKKKGDHFVGDYYVQFNNAYKAQVETLVQDGVPKAVAEKEAPIMQQTQQMLVDWEAGEPTVRSLWQQMNSWVYAGFDETYNRIGITFDKTYYESETYLLGKTFVDAGLKKGVLYKKEDGSVWIDLRADGLDEKLLLRGDGTSVYITQDLGLAQEKFNDYPYEQSIYVIGDEQNYHMTVLKLILQKMELPYANGVYHLSYGMVELPSGRMKSREGTVVDADDMIEEMLTEATAKTASHSDVSLFENAELNQLYETIGLGALKFFLLRVDPKKKMVFNPEESIDFHGFTGPFIQYTYARIKSILRKAGLSSNSMAITQPLLPLEKTLLLLLEQYSNIIQQAAAELNPAVVANYIFLVAQTYNSFYAAHPVMRAESEEKKALRLRLCSLTAETVKHAMHLLGISVPERM